MTNFIFYKYSFEKNFHKLSIPYDYITLGELKTKLNQKAVTVKMKKLDFIVKNIHTNKLISEQNEKINKNSYLNVTRLVNLENDKKSSQVEAIKKREQAILNSIKFDKIDFPSKQKLPSGIPKSSLIIVGPNNRFMTPIELMALNNSKKDDFLKYIDEEAEDIRIKLGNKNRIRIRNNGNSKKNLNNQFICPYGDHLIKEAVILPCCGNCYCCNSCVLNKMYNDEEIECNNSLCKKDMGPLENIMFSEIFSKKMDLNEIN